MNLSLPAQIQTLEDLAEVTDELLRYADWKREKAVRKQVGSGGAGRAPVLSQAAEFLLAQARATTAREIAGLAKELGSIRRQAPVAHLTFPASPPQSTVERLVEWFRQNVRPDTLLTVSVDRTLLGGMILRTKDSYFDFSFATALEANRDKLPRVIRHA